MLFRCSVREEKVVNTVENIIDDASDIVDEASRGESSKSNIIIIRLTCQFHLKWAARLLWLF